VWQLRLKTDLVDVLNASVEWSAPKNAWGIRLCGRNLTGTQYCAFETATTLNDSCAPATANLRHDAERKLLSSFCRSICASQVVN
jgi:hypothetical protein